MKERVERQVRIKVLGSAAGGGFPQWNCRGRMSAAVRAGKVGFLPRKQSSVALSVDGKGWILLNASPDLRQQILEEPSLWPDPEGPLRNSPIRAVILTNADVDHLAGLLHLREGHAFSIFSSKEILQALDSNPIFRVCDPAIVARRVLPLEEVLRLNVGGEDQGISIEAFAVPGKIALFLEDPSAPAFGSREGDTLGLKITDTQTGRFFLYLPTCAAIDPPLAKRLEGSPLVFFDGTLYAEDEMIRQGLSSKTGRRMGHLAIAGEGGSLAAFADLGVQRKIYLHVNNSNPILEEGSAERREVEAAGWEVALDGMEIAL